MILEFGFDGKSIDDVIRVVKSYKDDLEKKTETLVNRLTEDVRTNAARELINHLDTGETLNSMRVERVDTYTRNLIVGGSAIWLEFGTGVVANPVGVGNYAHPKAEELGMFGIGEYGHGHGADPNGWWYYDESGRKHHTYGIPATMFLYHSVWAARADVGNMVRGMFKA